MIFPVPLFFCVSHQETQGAGADRIADFFHNPGIAGIVTEQGVFDHKDFVIQILTPFLVYSVYKWYTFSKPVSLTPPIC